MILLYFIVIQLVWIWSNINYVNLWHFCKNPVCPDPVWKLLNNSNTNSGNISNANNDNSSSSNNSSSNNSRGNTSSNNSSNNI